MTVSDSGDALWLPWALKHMQGQLDRAEPGGEDTQIMTEMESPGQEATCGKTPVTPVTKGLRAVTLLPAAWDRSGQKGHGPGHREVGGQGASPQLRAGWY